MEEGNGGWDYYRVGEQTIEGGGNSIGKSLQRCCGCLRIQSTMGRDIGGDIGGDMNGDMVGNIDGDMDGDTGGDTGGGGGWRAGQQAGWQVGWWGQM